MMQQPTEQSDLDRLSPSLRPSTSNSGTQRWQNLLFLHWKVPLETLRRLVPTELEIDTFNGFAYVALVPFRMREIRPAWLPRRFAFNFFETNVRTYVTHRGRPGVYFFSLDASSRLAVWAARVGWALPYFYAQMKGSTHAGVSTFSCNRDGHKSRVEFQVEGEFSSSHLGTLEHFLLERYLLFVKRKERIYVGQVHHAPYRFARARVISLDDQLLSKAGLDLGNRQPDLAHYSPGVDVEVFRIVPT